MSWRLTVTAADDLDRIFEIGAETFGIDAAERYTDEFFRVFDLIAATPQMGRVERGRNMTARVLPRGSHMIVYRVEEAGEVTILRIPHQREDWISLFR